MVVTHNLKLAGRLSRQIQLVDGTALEGTMFYLQKEKDLRWKQEFYDTVLSPARIGVDGQGPPPQNDQKEWKYGSQANAAFPPHPASLYRNES